MRVLAVLCVRNEAAFLLEWLAHHRAAGFTDFLVFSNDCQDGTDRMLDHLQDMGQLVHVRNEGPYDKGGIQFTALKQADRHPLMTQADWVLVLDIDEFVCIKTGGGKVADLLAALPEADAVTLTWRLFGNAGAVRYQDAPVTEQFTRCAPEVIHWPWRAVMFKTLYRNDGTYRKCGVHRPRDLGSPAQLDSFRWYDCEGRELGRAFKTKRLFSNYGQPNGRLAQLNHYPLGAMESYVLKADRGRVNRQAELGMDYWVERNYCSAEDTSIARYGPASADLRAVLMDDPELARLHSRAVAWRRARFAGLMTQEPYRALFARLLMTPPARPVSPAAADLLRSFAIPDQPAAPPEEDAG
ncbi:glycosyltransferase family 2 protein [Leisingera methylohalidivorans]|uniref:Glycosyl transferase family 2 n=1 Tax=Leisingera methylohalidivorans DSM 14336 TaxID=999552 RepID=V9VUA3_9RHOB|nr:glycosyltransferase family 2 protein [Leisingera methylohalidivorans]AHD01264.1 glycosyl transferase family 2 [Leisingera methylohalidivorans DSM 14336]